MINVMKMKLYPYFVNQIAIPTNDDKPYNILFMSENSNFLETYSKLNIRRQFVKNVTIVPSKIPHLMVTTKDLMPYRKSLSLVPSMITDNKTNTYIDITPFFNIIDSQYGKGSYKQSTIMSKIISYLNNAKSFGDHKSILIYHINLDKELPEQLIHSKAIILAMISKIGDGTFPYDNVLIAREQNGAIKFCSIFNKEEKHFDSNRIFSILKMMIQPKEKELKEPTVITSLPEKKPENDEKQSILNAIDQYQKKRVITS